MVGWICLDAFYGCTNLALVEIAEGPELIEEGAFCGCESLREIQIPALVTRIGCFTFTGYIALAPKALI